MLANFSIKSVIKVYAYLWVLWLVLHCYLLIDFGVPMGIAMVDSLITQLLLAFSTFLIHITLKYYQPSKENFFYLRIWVVLLSIGNTAILLALLEFFYAHNLVYVSLLDKSIFIRFCYQLIMVSVIALVQWLGNYIVEQRLLEDRKQQAERFSKEAELYNLRQQLQPHFLFNSLNSISALAGSKPEQARNMIQQLSEFLRHTLRKDEQQLITLKEELKQLHLYLEIEKVRFGNRLRSTIIVPPSCEDLLLPVLILQPLVENAIKFGLYDTLGEVEILIEVSCIEGKWLQIKISNPFDPSTRVMPAMGTGFGLESIKRRLYLLYANNDLVQTENIENQFIVSLNIPQK